ncbi:MAG: hypothetical protein CSA22_10455 [Deltaproteobacteria bacterium]|nr:MAG: hypothetical protein CSA22_10455 [Deltaproteobacteria bacterium]
MTTTKYYSGTKFPAFGKIILNGGGVVTSGSYNSLVSKSITGGGLAVGSRGKISGELYLADDETQQNNVTQTIEGWMDADKNFVYQVVSWMENNTLHLASGLMIKETGTDFEESQLWGNWEGFAIEASPQNPPQEPPNQKVYYFNSEMLFSIKGYYGTWSLPYGQSGNINPSTMSINEKGLLWGTLYVDAGGGVTEEGQIGFGSDTPTGKIAENRELGIANIYKDNGKVSTMVFVKDGGATDFSESDLQGEWAVFVTEMIGGAPPKNLYWITANLKLDATGTLVSGDWKSFQGTTGTFLSGDVDISATGELSGTFTTSDGREMTTDEGRMGIARTYAACTLTKKDIGDEDFDTLNLGFFVKKTGPKGTLAPQHLLLLN